MYKPQPLENLTREVSRAPVTDTHFRLILLIVVVVLDSARRPLIYSDIELYLHVVVDVAGMRNPLFRLAGWGGIDP